MSWPPGLQAVFRWLSALNLNLEVTAQGHGGRVHAPRPGKFLFTLALPLAVAAVLVGVHAASVAVKCAKGKRSNLHRDVPLLVGVFLVLAYFCSGQRRA